MEESFEEGEEIAHNRTEKEGENDLDNRLEKDGNNAYRAGLKSLCNAEGEGEENEAYSVVKSNDGKENIRERTLCLILLYNHESCRRCCCGSYCTENDSRLEGELIGHKEVEADKNCVNQESCENSLEDADYGCLLACCLELGKTEFVTDGECDEAESNLRKSGEMLDLLHAAESETGNSELADEIRTDENTCNEVCRNRRKF